MRWCGRHTAQHGGLEERAAVAAEDGVPDVATAGDGGSFGDGVGHHAGDAVGGGPVDDGADVGRRVGRVAEAELVGPLGDALDELAGHVGVDDQPRRRRAALPAGAEGAEDGAVDDEVEVGVGPHDHGVLAAQLQRHEPGPGLHGRRGHLAAGRHRAGEADGADAGMDGDGRARLGVAVDQLEKTFRNPGLETGGHERLGAGRGVLGRLEHDAVAGQEGGEALPRRDGHREVPRRDHPDDPDGGPGRPAQLGAELRRDRLAPGGPALPGHEVGHVDGLLHVAAGLEEDLPALPGDQLGQLRLAGEEDLAGPDDHAGPGGDGHPGPPALGGGGRLDGPVDVGGALDGERPDDLGRAGGVDGVERGHGSRSLTIRLLKRLFQGYGHCNVCAMIVSAQIDAHLRDLTPAERRVAAVVADDPEAVAFGTVADVARRAGTSGATVVRLAAKLGFDGFVQLQGAVQEEMTRRLRPASERIRRPVPGDVLGSALAVEMANVAATLEGVDGAAFDQAVALLSGPVAAGKGPRPGSGRALVLSGDASSGVASLFADELSMLRPGVALIGGSEVRVARLLADVGPSDLHGGVRSGPLRPGGPRRRRPGRRARGGPGGPDRQCPVPAGLGGGRELHGLGHGRRPVRQPRGPPGPGQRPPGRRGRPPAPQRHRPPGPGRVGLARAAAALTD